MNRLYYGDNLTVLREAIASQSVDLVYLDPPFKSNQDYNVLFATHDGAKAAAQIQAFEDTWEWNEESARTCQEVIEGGGDVADAMLAFKALLGDSDMMAYLAMMAPRLVELRRVLKATGSLYLHCDPTASHYLKLLMDSVFGAERFVSEIIWKRYGAHGNSKNYGAVHDVILFYTKSGQFTFNRHFQPYEQRYLEQRFRFRDSDGRRWAEQNLNNPARRPNLTYAFTARNGVTYQPPANGWKFTLERMTELDTAGRLHYPQRRTGRLRLKNYLDEMPGVPISDVWTDITTIGGTSPERLGYPTQKPEGLLERIVNASSNDGDIVLDPFCGCGTTIAAAQTLKRRWIGIDITYLAINLIRQRLRDRYGPEIDQMYEVIGQPTTVQDAAALAAEKPYQFQWWAASLVGGRLAEQKKGADRGIDGRLFFHDEGPKGKTKQIVLSVKAGHVKPEFVRELRGVLEREEAAIGVLLTLHPPTPAMRKEATHGGFYQSPWGSSHPRLQILTVGELLEGKRIDYPAGQQTNRTFRRARRHAEVEHSRLLPEL